MTMVIPFAVPTRTIRATKWEPLISSDREEMFYTHVLALVDGRHTVGQIARLLSRSIFDVHDALEFWVAARMIHKLAPPLKVVREPTLGEVLWNFHARFPEPARLSLWQRLGFWLESLLPRQTVKRYG